MPPSGIVRGKALSIQGSELPKRPGEQKRPCSRSQCRAQARPLSPWLQLAVSLSSGPKCSRLFTKQLVRAPRCPALGPLPSLGCRNAQALSSYNVFACAVPSA